MKLSRWRAQSNNFAESVVGGGGVAHGPTVQIARGVSSIALSAGSPTANVPFTALDANGVATGARVYGVSSDPTVTTILPDAPWTATRVAAGSAVLYGQLTDPGGEPFYSGAAGQSLIMQDNMSGYTGSTIAAMMANTSGQTLRLMPIQADPLCAIVTGLDGTGTALKVMGVLNVDNSNTSSTFVTYPESPSPVPSAMHNLHHFAGYEARITKDANAQGFNYTRVKWFEGWPDLADVTRFQFDTADSPQHASTTHPEVWGVYDQSYPVPNYMNNQPVGPYFNDLANDGLKHRFKYEYKANTADPGTIDLQIKVAAVTFRDSQAGVLSVGSIIRLRANDSIGISTVATAGQSLSTAEFQLLSFNGSTVASVTRLATTGNTLTSYTGGINVLSSVTVGGVFSQSRAGAITLSRPVAIPGFNFLYEFSAFDGTTGVTLNQLSPDPGDGSAMQHDYFGLRYSTTLDGIARMWIDGTKIIDISLATVGITPTGGEQAWCNLTSIASLNVGRGTIELRFGEAQSGGVGYSKTFQNLIWWSTAT